MWPPRHVGPMAADVAWALPADDGSGEKTGWGAKWKAS